MWTSLAVGAVWLLTSVLAHPHIHNETFHPDYVLYAGAGNLRINCEDRHSVTINGSSPAPTLHLKEGHTTWIRVYNHIPDQNFTIHWHGLAQRVAPFSDGTPLVSQWPIAPGQFFDYEIRPEHGDAGTYFYHSHVGFQQVTAHGALIVDDSGKPPYHYDEDITLMSGDYYVKDDKNITAGLVGEVFAWSGEPLAVTIQGQSGNASFSNATDESCAPHVVDVEPGKTYRLRFIGTTAMSLVELGIEGHDKLDIIEADGAYTEAHTIDHIQFAPGQRFSALLKTKSKEEIKAANQTDYWIRYESRLRPTLVTGYALLRYHSSCNEKSGKPLPKDLPQTPPVKLPTNVTGYLEGALRPHSKQAKAEFPRLSEVTRTVSIVVNQKLATGAYINGAANGTLIWVENGGTWNETRETSMNRVPYLVQVYEDNFTSNYTRAMEHEGFDPVSQTFPAKVGEVLDIVWQNNNGHSGGWDFHPMHIHGEHAWDLGSGNGTYDAAANERRFSGGRTPVRRDTTLLYPYATSGVPWTTAGWRAWRIRVTEENVGLWMMHCHVAQHAIMGMNTVWQFGDAEHIKKKFPDPPYAQGYLQFGGSAYGDEDNDPVVNHYYPEKDE